MIGGNRRQDARESRRLLPCRCGCRIRAPVNRFRPTKGRMVAVPTPNNLGFLSVHQEQGGYVGGYLVTNAWGRPLEFRLSSAVQPNKVQAILYGGTLQPYICADLIGKTLVDKAGLPVQLIVTDREAVLDLRLKVEAVVLWLA